MDFANYAFNKAHAVCYAVVSYRTAYLKCHYPREYLAALLTSVLDSAGKISEYIAEARDMGIRVLPPDVNESEDGFSVAGEHIRFGLAAIKNVGRAFMKQLVAEREANGPFLSISDFCERMFDKDLNRRAVESLIKAGAFDSMGYRRSQFLAVYESVIDAVSANRKKNVEGQLDLFGMGVAEVHDIQVAMPDLPELQKRDLLAQEKLTTGLYLSGHPMDEYRELADRARSARVRRIVDDLSEGAESPYYKDGMNVRLACVVSAVRLKATRNGSMMAYATVEDMTGMMEVVVFPKTLQQYSSYLSEDSAILLSGRLDAREDEAPKLIAQTVAPLTEESVAALSDRQGGAREIAAGQPAAPVQHGPQAKARPGQRVYLRVPDMTGELCEETKQTLMQHPGTIQVVFCPAPRNLWCAGNLQLMQKLRFILGDKNAIIK